MRALFTSAVRTAGFANDGFAEIRESATSGRS